MSYKIISLKKIVNSIGEEKSKKLLNTFKCEKNKDVEYFLREKAIEFSKQGISETFIVTTSYKGDEVIAGYFALANKVTKIKRGIFSNTTKRRFAKFATYDGINKCYTIALPLIGQVGRNFNNSYDKLIDGDLLLKLACDKIKEAQEILGGRFVFLECEDKTVLTDLYERNGFVCFGKRSLEKDELDKNTGSYLLQMLCDLSKK